MTCFERPVKVVDGHGCIWKKMAGKKMELAKSVDYEVQIYMYVYSVSCINETEICKINNK